MRMKCKLIVGEKWYHKKLIAEYFADKVYEKLNSKNFKSEWGDVSVELVCEDKNSPKAEPADNTTNTAVALSLKEVRCAIGEATGFPGRGKCISILNSVIAQQPS